MKIRKTYKKCPVCGDKDDGYIYESDIEQKQFGYPEEYRMCQTCGCPLLEIGDGHCEKLRR